MLIKTPAGGFLGPHPSRGHPCSGQERFSTTVVVGLGSPDVASQGMLPLQAGSFPIPLPSQQVNNSDVVNTSVQKDVWMLWLE